MDAVKTIKELNDVLDQANLTGQLLLVAIDALQYIATHDSIQDAKLVAAQTLNKMKSQKDLFVRKKGDVVAIQ